MPIVLNLKVYGYSVADYNVEDSRGSNLALRNFAPKIIIGTRCASMIVKVSGTSYCRTDPDDSLELHGAPKTSYIGHQTNIGHASRRGPSRRGPSRRGGGEPGWGGGGGVGKGVEQEDGGVFSSEMKNNFQMLKFL